MSEWIEFKDCVIEKGVDLWLYHPDWGVRLCENANSYHEIIIGLLGVYPTHIMEAKIPEPPEVNNEN